MDDAPRPTRAKQHRSCCIPMPPVDAGQVPFPGTQCGFASYMIHSDSDTVHGQDAWANWGYNMVDERPDRLEEIAATRANDPDVRWLLDEVLRLRAELEAEHAVALQLARLIRLTFGAVRPLRHTSVGRLSAARRFHSSRRRQERPNSSRELRILWIRYPGDSA